MINVVIFVIFCLVFVGLLGWYRAILGIKREVNLLNDTDALRQSILGDSGHFVMRMSSFERWLKENRGEHDASREIRVGAGHHLLLRLVTIHESISHNEEARVIPSLHDLHSLSLQDEMSRWSSTLLRMVTSVLLVVGILGTLIGVHEVLANPALELAELRAALSPSMAAVFCTVVLMWLRGWYTAQFESYLEKLDLFTMTDIIPHLQPVSQVGTQAAVLNAQVASIRGKIERVQEMAEKMQKFCDEVYASANRLETVSEKMKEANMKISSRYTEMSGALTESESRFQQIQSAINNGKNAEMAFASHLSLLDEQNSGAERHCKEAEEQYKTMFEHLRKLAGEIDTARNDMSRVSAHADKMLTLGKTVADYGHGLSSVLSGMEQVQKEMKTMEELKEKIGDSDNVVYNSADTAHAALKETESSIMKFNSYHDDFNADISRGNQTLTSALSRLEGQVNLLKNEASALHAIFEKRRSKKSH